MFTLFWAILSINQYETQDFAIAAFNFRENDPCHQNRERRIVNNSGCSPMFSLFFVTAYISLGPLAEFCFTDRVPLTFTRGVPPDTFSTVAGRHGDSMNLEWLLEFVMKKSEITEEKLNLTSSSFHCLLCIMYLPVIGGVNLIDMNTHIIFSLKRI